MGMPPGGSILTSPGIAASFPGEWGGSKPTGEFKGGIGPPNISGGG